jgi:hypothetical protein
MRVLYRDREGNVVGQEPAKDLPWPDQGEAWPTQELEYEGKLFGYCGFQEGVAIYVEKRIGTATVTDVVLKEGPVRGPGRKV